MNKPNKNHIISKQKDILPITFMQKDNQPQIFIQGVVPTILFTPHAMSKITALVQLADTEINWFGHCTWDKELPPHKIDKILVDEIYLFDQEVTETSVDISPESFIKAHEYFEERGELHIMQDMLFEGHSHVNMETFFSGADSEDLEIMARDKPFAIKGVFNKKGDVTFEYMNNNAYVHIKNIPFKIQQEYLNSSLVEDMIKEVNEKVKVRKNNMIIYNSRWPYEDETPEEREERELLEEEIVLKEHGFYID